MPKTVADLFRSSKKSSSKSKLFEKKQFYVFPSSELLRYEVEQNILNNEGSLVQNPNRLTDYLIAKDSSSIKVKNWIDISKKGENPYGDKDILNYQFVFDCVKQNKIIPKHPMYMIYTSKETKKQFETQFDQYSNSYTEYDTPETLKFSIEQVKNKHTFFNLSDKDKKLIHSHFELETIY